MVLLFWLVARFLNGNAQDIEMLHAALFDELVQVSSSGSSQINVRTTASRSLGILYQSSA